MWFRQSQKKLFSPSNKWHQNFNSDINLIFSAYYNILKEIIRQKKAVYWEFNLFKDRDMLMTLARQIGKSQRSDVLLAERLAPLSASGGQIQCPSETPRRHHRIILRGEGPQLRPH